MDAPVTPPREWFYWPEPDQVEPFTWHDNGRVAGHAAPWGACHLGFPNGCRTPPHSQVAYRFFHVGELLCLSGERVSVGPLTMRGDHAGTRLSASQARRHYADSSMVVAHLRAYEGRHGIWMCGAAIPDLSAEQLREAMTLAPSGDWRWQNGQLEMVHAHLVPFPGYTVTREAALVASADVPDPGVVVMSLVAGAASVISCECDSQAAIDRLLWQALGRDAMIADALAE